MNLIRIISNRTLNFMVEFRFNQFTKNISSRSNHEVQLQWHRRRRQPFWTLQPLPTSVQRNLISDHWHRHQSLTLSRLIEFFHGAGANYNLRKGKINRRWCDVEAEKRRRVTESKFDGGVHRHHISCNSGEIRPGLNRKFLKCNTLYQTQNQNQAMEDKQFDVQFNWYE